jgi:hypothetical protein
MPALTASLQISLVTESELRLNGRSSFLFAACLLCSRFWHPHANAELMLCLKPADFVTNSAHFRTMIARQHKMWRINARHRSGIQREGPT